MSSSTNYNKYNSNVVKLLKGSIVLCVHGVWSDGYTFDSMIKKMENNYLFNYNYGCSSLYDESGNRIYLNGSNVKDANYRKNLKKLIANNKDKNLFIPVNFENNHWGLISHQTNELSSYVDFIHSILNEANLNMPIILLGHSKGGLVSMNCALDNAKVTKLVSVGTPYDGTILDCVFNAVADGILGRVTGGIWNIISSIVEIFDGHYVNLFNEFAQTVISGVITDAAIIEKWNSKKRYIPCTIIGGDAVEFSLNGNKFSGDYVVPISSACTPRLNNTTIYEINNTKIKITVSNLIHTLMKTESFSKIKDMLIDYVNNGLKLSAESFKTFVDLFMNSLKEAGIDLGYSLDIAHCSMLGHERYILNDTEACLRIVAGLNAN